MPFISIEQEIAMIRGLQFEKGSNHDRYLEALKDAVSFYNANSLKPYGRTTPAEQLEAMLNNSPVADGKPKKRFMENRRFFVANFGSMHETYLDGDFDALEKRKERLLEEYKQPWANKTEIALSIALLRGVTFLQKCKQDQEDKMDKLIEMDNPEWNPQLFLDNAKKALEKYPEPVNTMEAYYVRKYLIKKIEEFKGLLRHENANRAAVSSSSATPTGDTVPPATVSSTVSPSPRAPAANEKPIQEVLENYYANKAGVRVDEYRKLQQRTKDALAPEIREAVEAMVNKAANENVGLNIWHRCVANVLNERNPLFGLEKHATASMADHQRMAEQAARAAQEAWTRELQDDEQMQIARDQELARRLQEEENVHDHAPANRPMLHQQHHHAAQRRPQAAETKIRAFCEEHKIPHLDMNAFAKSGHTALTLCAKLGDLEQMDLFIRHYQDQSPGLSIKDILNFPNAYGNTPLHLAVDKNHIALVEFCLRLGADPKCMNNNHKSPVDIARSRKFQPIVDLFERQNNDVLAENQSNRAPIHHRARPRT